MALSFAVSTSKVNSTVCVPPADEDVCRDPEIIRRLDRLDQALGELQSVVHSLTDRLSPVMSEPAASGGSGTEPDACTTTIGQRLQIQESTVRGATGAVLSILQRLEI